MGQGEPEPDGPGAHHLHGGRDGLLRRRRQEDPLAGEAALVRGGARAPQEHLLPGRRPPAPGLLQALIALRSDGLSVVPLDRWHRVLDAQAQCSQGKV